MITTMSMDSYEIEQDAMEIEYSDEIMNVGWNPAVELVCELLQVPTDEQIATASELPEMETLSDFSTAISDIIRRKMYSYQH